MLILMCVHDIQKHLKCIIFKIIPNLQLSISKHNNKINNWYRNSNTEHPKEYAKKEVKYLYW
jgi:hypothetical protein